VERALNNYAKYILFTIDKQKSISYFKNLLEKYSVKYYKKQMHSIKKFLLHLGVDWANEIVLPKDPITNIKHIDTKDIVHAINSFNNSKYSSQLNALILLGASSGLRAEELYQLQPRDIDLENRKIYVNHNPKNGQSTKTGKSRISYFNSEAQQIFSEYIEYFEKETTLKQLFSQTHITHLFRGSPLKVKDLRKYFSQEWDRRGGPTSIKKILMGHSLRGDIDLMHYNAQSEEDLKKIYDKVFNKHEILE
jgi:integrase/recombinase XerD